MKKQNNHLLRLAAAIVFVVGIALFISPLSALAVPSSSTPDEELLKIDVGLPETIRDELLDIAPAMIALSGKEPKVLIYHTHTTEAYTATSDAPYEETSPWHTTDTKNNVVAVGNALKDALKKYGIRVIHDTTNHTLPKLATAYERSLVTMQKYKEQYPSIEIFIDVHRDASAPSNNSAESTDYVMIDGKKVARIGLDVGTSEIAGESTEKPNYKDNCALAKAVCNQLNAISPTITRQIWVKKGRYNQHVGRCLLINVGHNQNTLEEAINATEYLAKAIANTANSNEISR